MQMLIEPSVLQYVSLLKAQMKTKQKPPTDAPIKTPDMEDYPSSRDCCHCFCTGVNGAKFTTIASSQCCFCGITKESVYERFIPHTVACTGEGAYHAGSYHLVHCACICVEQNICTHMTYASRTVLDLYTCICTFYVLNELRMAPIEGFKKSHEKWSNDLDAVTGTFNTTFGAALFDYIVASSWGEAKHSLYECDIAMYTPELNRSSLLPFATYDVARLIPLFITLFEDKSWTDCYGGKAWANIARAATEYGKRDLTLWIDHVVDLGHNNGCFFDKGKMFPCFLPTILDLLTFKREGSLLYDASVAILTPPVYSLLNRAVNLKIVENVNQYVLPGAELDYVPVVYGSMAPPILGESPRARRKDARRNEREEREPFDDDIDENCDDSECQECYRWSRVICNMEGKCKFCCLCIHCYNCRQLFVQTRKQCQRQHLVHPLCAACTKRDKKIHLDPSQINLDFNKGASLE
jgi:hypothetical protein